jgi:hypothetical protein
VPNVVAQLTILLNDDGTVGVSGPIDNKMLSYGMLETAKEAIFLHNQNKDKRIIAAPAGLRVVPPNGQG